MKRLLAVAIVFMIYVYLFIRLFGCAPTPIAKPDVTGVPTCGKGNGVSCLKCHDFRVVTVPWHDSENNTKYVEIILPEGVDIDWESSRQTIVINPERVSTDWVIRNVFVRADPETGLWIINVIYEPWCEADKPPMPPLCLVQYTTDNPSVPGIMLDTWFWIYRRGMPEEVTEDEIDLFILGLSGDKI